MIPKDGQEDYIIDDLKNIKEYFYTKNGYVAQAICNSLDAIILLTHQYKTNLKREKPCLK